MVKPQRPPSRQQPAPPAATHPTISARWLLSAFALTLCAAALCGYAALCLLFYQGQWQFLFHPSRTIAATPATAGLAFDDIRFDVNDTGLPRLDGWWIPAVSGAPYSSSTILYLHDARGSLSDTVPALAALHNLGINIFAIDYQGFGRSAGAHPTERLATQDSAAAFAWLTDTRHISPGTIIVYGDGVGAVFAAHLAALFAPAGVILQDPNPPAGQIFLQDPRARMLPLVLLQKEKLDPKADLARAHIPRLFIDRQGDSARTRQLFLASSDRKEYFDLRAASESTVDATLRRFLDEVLR
ncbi:MAG: alpha/beta hydrolase fold domain-containing protein [Acidobacteriaceae bacterium]